MVQRCFIVFIGALFCTLNVKGQTDTTVVNKYVVDKKIKKVRDGEQAAMLFPPPEGCSLTGPGTAARGSTSFYLLSCSDGALADYWEISCGTATDWWGDEVVVQWSTSSGCTSGTVRARKMDGTILATKTVTLTTPPPPPPPAITYTPLFTSSNFTKIIDLAKPVGTVAGSAGTTLSGGVTYSFPIYTPPGTNGLQPSVSISYNSQAASGIAGWGWNISGLSVISRTGKNIYHNGIVKPVSYTTEDAFLLDGMRLNAITGSNGANGTIYAGEAESFAKIISYTTGSANNPDWFKVTAKDGSIMEFGHTTDSRIMTDNGTNVMLWRLNRILDINGNYIDFVYDNLARDSRIKTIKYTGNINTGLVPYNSLTFSYKLRADRNIGYDAGGSMTSHYLLDKITIIADDDYAVKNYQFNYGFDNVNSLLKEVIESANGTTSLNSTIFLYGDQPSNISTTSTTALQGEYDFFAGDFDADGKTDLLAAKSYFDENADTRLHTEYSLISEINASGNAVLYTKTLTLPQNISSEILTDKKHFNFLNSDYNGDGRDDVLQINTSLENFWCGVGYRRKMADATLNYTKSFNNQTGYTDYQEQSFSYPTAFGIPYQYISDKGNFFVPGDFDGDGNQDYILILGKKRQTGTCLISLPVFTFDFKAFITSPSTNEINNEIGNFGFGSNPTPDFYAGTVAGADMINVLDFDGDGKMEILVTKDGTSYVLSIQRVSVTTGFSFAASVIYTTTEIIKDNRLFPGDFNGDRKTDLLVRKNDGTWKILYSTGTAFTASVFTFNQAVSFTGNYGDHLLQVSDFNGDGKSDILHGYVVSGSSPTQSKLSLYYSKGYSSSPAFYYEQYTYNNQLAYGVYGSSEGIVLGDFNGDGRTDLINRYYIGSPADFISLKSFGKERLLAKVTDGHNTTTVFEYKLLTDKSTYPYFYNRTVSLDDPANKNPFNYVQLPMYAVSSIIVPDGINGNNTTTFNYENAVVHRAAKGFLGFKKITAKNAVANIVSITENEINTQFAVSYPARQTTRLISPDQLLSESQVTNSFVNRSTGFGDTRYQQKIDKTLSIDYLNNRASESVNTYDSYGNIATNVNKTGILSGTTVAATETATTTTTYSIQNTPVPARPDNVTISKVRAGMPSLSTTTAYTYTTNGLPVTQTVFSGLPKAVTTTFAYNAFGNPLTAVISSAGLNSRTTTNTYDWRGRFALTKQVSGGTLSQTETYTYDVQWGKPLSHISGDCLTTSFEYDLFGRLKKTTLPQGFAVSNSLVWEVSGNNVFYAFTDYPGGSPDIKTWFDKLGRETKTQTAGFNSQWLTRLTTYNAKGQTATQTNDYYSSETPLTATNTYDVYGRLTTAANTLNTVTNTYTTLSNGRAQVVTSGTNGQSATKISDATGKIVTAIDNGGQLDFIYDSRGNQTQVKHGSTILVTSVYDVYGRQTSLADKNAGTVTYTYNGFGQLTQQTDAIPNTYTMLYDGLGRITSRTGTEGTTTYEYYMAGSCSNNNPSKITGFNGVKKEYTYDTYKRPATEKVTIDGIAYTTAFTYNTYNALTKTVYPSGIEENKTYDANGGLLTVTGGNAGALVTLFTATAVNGFGQYTGFTQGNGKTSQHTYHYGTPTRYYTAGVQDLNLNFDYTKGNLLSRNDAIKNITENFTFDNLNRLTSATVNGTQQFAMTYDGTSTSSMGNIATKTDAGNYVYKTDKIHAVAYITNPAGAQTPPANISTVEQLITYNPFLKAATITEAPNKLEFTYGPDYQRVKTLFKNSSTNALLETRLFLGSYEKQIIAGGATREIHYIGGGNGVCAILVKEAGVVTPYFVYTDHLGSILTITNAAGTIIGEQNFDAWGRKRNPANWQYAGVPVTPTWMYRGYTAHEHLPQFSLINMNGRIYDPVQGRMLSPDNYVVSIFNTQGYNRYSYGNNNPLSYIDPDGNIVWFIVAAAAIIGGTVNGIAYANNGGSFWGGFWRGAVVGGAAALTGGAIAGAIPGFSGAVLGGLAGGIVNGGLGAALNGGNVVQGLMFGAMTGVVGGGVGAYFGGGTGAFIGGAAAGALGAELTGGNALTGALIGGASSWAMYHGMNYYNYSRSSLRSMLTYKQFAKIGGDYQRSIMRHKEFGGVAFDDGSIVRAKASDRHSLRVDVRYRNVPGRNAVLHYHTHWAKANINYYTNNFEDIVSQSNALADPANHGISTTASGPSPADQSGIAPMFRQSILIDRSSFYSYTPTAIAQQPLYHFTRSNIFSIFPYPF